MQLRQAEITQQNQQKYIISGVVDFSTVPDLLRRSSDFFKATNTSESRQQDSRQVTFDLSQVEECNSAVLALIIEIVKSAKVKNIDIHFENLPETLLSIAKAYGVEDEIREL